MKKPEQVLRLADTGGMLRRIAEAMVKAHGVYYCTVDGKRTKIVP